MGQSGMRAVGAVLLVVFGAGMAVMFDFTDQCLPCVPCPSTDAPDLELRKTVDMLREQLAEGRNREEEFRSQINELRRKIRLAQGHMIDGQGHASPTLKTTIPPELTESEAPQPPPLYLAPLSSHPSSPKPSKELLAGTRPTLKRDPMAKPPRVSISMTVYPDYNPKDIYPRGPVCPGVQCNVHYSTIPQEYGMTPHLKKLLPTADVFSIYLNTVPNLEFYDPIKNPLNLTLMATINENMVARNMTLLHPTLWLGKFYADPRLWDHFHITNAQERTSTLPFYYWNHLNSIASVQSYRRANPPLSFEGKYQPTLAIFISSHPGHSYNRFKYVKWLSNHMPIDYYSGKRSFHTFFKNRGGAKNVTVRARPDCPPSGWYDPSTTLCLIRPYYFNLAYENSEKDDYVTEKVYDPMLVGVVPIYRGAPNINDFVPPRTVILATDFPNEGDLAYYLRCLVANKELYEEYRAFAKRHSFEWQTASHGEHIMCQACRQVVAEREYQTQEAIARGEGPPNGVYDDDYARMLMKRAGGGRLRNGTLGPRNRGAPDSVPVKRANRCNQRPIQKCLRPGSSLPDYYNHCGDG